jgi:hypothetical protein
MTAPVSPNSPQSAGVRPGPYYIQNGVLHLRDVGAAIPTSDIRLIAAEGGVNLDGGEMLVWRRNHVATERARYTLRLSPRENARFYEGVLAFCPQAVGLPYRGDLHLPRCPEHEDPARWVESALTITRRELRRQGQRGLIFAGVSLVISLGLVVSVVAYLVLLSMKLIEGGEQTAFRFGLAAVASGAFTVLLVARAWSQFRHAADVTKAIRKLQ